MLVLRATVRLAQDGLRYAISFAESGVGSGVGQRTPTQEGAGTAGDWLGGLGAVGFVVRHAPSDRLRHGSPRTVG